MVIKCKTTRDKYGLKQARPNYDPVGVYFEQPIFMLTDPNHYLRVLFLLHPNFRVFPRFSVVRPLTPETTKTQKFQSFESFFVFDFIFLLGKPHSHLHYFLRTPKQYFT